MTVALSPPMYLQFFNPNNSGAPAAGYLLFTYQAGTSVKQATWTDSTQTVQNSNPIILDSNGAAYVWLDTGLNYKFVFTSPNDTDPPTSAIRSEDNIQSGLTSAGLYPRTAAEIAAGITPTNFSYPEGDLRRYGGVGNGTTNDSVAWQSAVTVGIARIPSGLTFKIVTGATRVGQLTVLGEGPASKLQCDSLILTVTGGNASYLDNFWMENITIPYIITRQPTNWSAVLTPAQSNGIGYQPTNQDPEFATWVAAQPLVGTQNIGPVIQFQGAATDINISRIYGRFIRINIYDAVNSIVQNCDFQGGKGTFAAVLFDNCTNNVQQGANNQAINNRIGYASLNGIQLFSNVDFTLRGNTCYNCGESGTSTGQGGGVAFTASVGGATSGTLNAGWASPIGVWTFGFANGETRNVTITTVGQTAVAWSPALAAGTVLNTAYWGINGFPASTMDPRCGRGLIIGNRTYNQYYDGLDCDSVFGVTNDATQSGHHIENNYSFRNRLNGMNVDGQFNSVIGNHFFFNGQYGIWGVCSLCHISDNYLIDDNQLRNPAGIAEILADGAIALNKISDNFIWAGATQNCPGISVTTAAVNYVTNNFGIGPTTNALGSPGQVASVVESNTDATSGLSTSQCFTFVIQNNAGTIQHEIIADTANLVLNLTSSRVKNALNSFTTTPSGTDSSTAFAAGAKISSANTNQIIFDTAAQYNLNGFLQAVIARNSTGTAVNVAAFVASVNVNGSTVTRLFFQFGNSTTDAAFALTTGNIAAGKYLYVTFLGKLS